MTNQPPFVIAIDGHDGAAKTPICESVKQELTRRGLSVEIVAPFQLAKSFIPEADIYPYWSDGRAHIAAIILNGITVVHRLLAQSDVVIFDRHWLTVMVEIYGRDESSLWTEFVPMVFMKCRPEVARLHRKFSYDAPFTGSDEKMQQYYERYLAVASAFPELIVLEAEITHKPQDLGPIALAIVSIIEKNLRVKKTV